MKDQEQPHSWPISYYYVKIFSYFNLISVNKFSNNGSTYLLADQKLLDNDYKKHYISEFN